MKPRLGKQRTVTGSYSDDKADSGKDRIRYVELGKTGNAVGSDDLTRNIPMDWLDENSTQSAAIHPTKGVTQKR